MKRLFGFLLSLALLLSLCGCQIGISGPVVPDATPSPTPTAAPTPPASSTGSAAPQWQPLRPGEVLYIRAGSYGEDGWDALFPMENAGKMAISAVQHLPVLRFKTAEEFIARAEKLGEQFQLDASYDGNGSFTEKTAKFDEAFFEENELVLVYVYAPSGSIRHKVADVSIANGELMILVEELVPEVGTCDIAEWFIVLSFAKDDLAGCTAMDAAMIG